MLAFRRWLQEKAGGDVGWVGVATSKDLPAKLSRKEVLNRWERHGKNCADCTQVVCQHCFWGLNGPTWTLPSSVCECSPPTFPMPPLPKYTHNPLSHRSAWVCGSTLSSNVHLVKAFSGSFASCQGLTRAGHCKAYTCSLSAASGYCQVLVLPDDDNRTPCCYTGSVNH